MSKKYEILLVEDNPGDVRIIIEAFKENKIIANIHNVSDGVEALKFLKDNSKLSSKLDLILLDLNLPGMNGFEIIPIIKSENRLKQIPLIVFSSTEYKEDIEKCYKLGADSFISKPIDLDSHIKTIKFIHKKWLKK